jgi:SAM-dependent methyltransferase
MPTKANYSKITESPGLKATQEQLDRLYQRYNFASNYSKNKKVLEIACGSGLGLKYLARMSKRVTGIDIDEINIDIARKACANFENISVKLMDAHEMSFADADYDLILLFEAIYYLSNPKKFVSEAHRLLSNQGMLIICSVNKNWKDFHPSPYSCYYYSIPELRDLLKGKFDNIIFFGGFPVYQEGLKAKFFSLIKHTAIRLDLIPGSLASRAVLKRLFVGKTLPIPETLYDGITSYENPKPLPDDRPTTDWKIIYAIAQK